jgi:hypothetical protein
VKTVSPASARPPFRISRRVFSIAIVNSFVSSD